MLASWSYSYAPLMPGFGRPQEHVALLLLLVMSLLLGGFDWVIQASLKLFFTIGR